MKKPRRSRLDAIRLKRVMADVINEGQYDRVLSGLFPEQRAFVDDPSELKAALCTRRCGKTTAGAAYLISEALRTPGCNCVYIGLTRGTAKDLMLLDNAFIPKMLAEYNINAEINYSDLTVTFPNKSVIFITGMDASKDQTKKLYGKKFKLVIIDEVGSFRVDVKDLVYMKLRPAMAQGDHSGTIALIGTPENNRGFFYQVTCEEEDNASREPGWSVHHWSYEANPYERVAISAQIADLRERFPGIDTNQSHELYPMFQQHYCGRWVMDRNALVYAFNRERNLISELPPGNYTYVAGVDLGYRDAASIVTMAYRDFDPKLYVVDVFKQAGMPISDLALELATKNEKYKYARIISDHDPKVTRDIQNRFGLYMEPADKIDKNGFIAIMNGELLRARVMLVNPEKMAPLIKEFEELVWDKKILITGKKEEDPRMDNHCTDSLLYAWRKLYQYMALPEETTDSDPDTIYRNLLRRRVSREVKDKMQRMKRQTWR